MHLLTYKNSQFQLKIKLQAVREVCHIISCIFLLLHLILVHFLLLITQRMFGIWRLLLSILLRICLL